MSQELLPCPLDKGQATMTGKHLDERCGYGYEVTIRCKTCGCSVTRGNTSNDAGWNDEPSAQTESRAIAAWNTRPTAQAVAVDELSGNGLKLEAGFVYENGVHTPTVLISFPPGDFDGRDKFMRGIQQAALEGR